MDQGLITLLSGLCVSGGVIYLIVERFLNRKQTREDVRQKQTETMKNTIDYGIPMIEVYNEIDKIVESKTRPIQDKLDRALIRIDDLETNFCCYRKGCHDRIRTPDGRKKLDTVNDIDHAVEAQRKG